LALVLAMALVGLPPALAEEGQAEAGPELVIDGLERPVAMAFDPDGRIFIAERLNQVIRIIDNESVLDPPFYSLWTPGPWHGHFEQGLLGLALHPEFPAQPWVYAYHTFNDSANEAVYNRVVRIRADGNVGVSHEVLLDRIPSITQHNGGVIAFGPDGKLWAATGDGFLGAAAQNASDLRGKVLRMDDDGSAPFDNPFAGTPSGNPYVYTLGHRNVFGIAFHPVTEDAWVTENGPECNDEVNRLVKSRNYGWNNEWDCSPPTVENTNQGGLTPELPAYNYESTIAPTNIIAYTGPNEAFEKDLIHGDWVTGSLHWLDLEGPEYETVRSSTVLTSVDQVILDVEMGPDGKVWFTTQTEIYRYAPSLPTPPPDPDAPNATVPIAIMVVVTLLVVGLMASMRGKKKG
jgi:glucose/arabinose dehydrogenase